MSKLTVVVAIILSTTLVCKSQYALGENYYFNDFWKPDSIMTYEESQELFKNCGIKENWGPWIQQYSLGQGTDSSFQTAYDKALEKLDYRLYQTYSVYEMSNYEISRVNSVPIKKATKVIKKTIIENLDNGQYRVSIWAKLEFVN